MDTATVEAPETEKIEQPVGVYNDIPDADYRRWKALSNSELTQMIEWSPYHLKYWRTNPPPKTDALTFGSALHCRVLRPQDFDSEFCVSGQCVARKVDGDRCSNPGTMLSGGSWYCGVHSKKLLPDDMSKLEVITAIQMTAIEAMAEAIARHKAASNLLSSDGANEVSMRWDRIVHDKPLACKLRLDGIRPTWETILDIKTTDCARRADFVKSIGEYGYHRQAAYYIDGAQAAGYEHPIKHFVFIVVEKKPPYGVATYRLMNEAIDAGREELENPIGVYASCERSGNWWGYPSDFDDISIPAWKMREITNSNKL